MEEPKINLNFYTDFVEDIHTFGDAGQKVGGENAVIKLNQSSAKKIQGGGSVIPNNKASPALKPRRRNRLPHDYVFRPVSNYFKLTALPKESTRLATDVEQKQGGKCQGSTGTQLNSYS